ncbi:MAG: helix-turn-helix transcriptional regulator [Tenacibaculum sp.]|uniref:helix-turn-helix transcriptional regulator n=1 Tax=Tenacibaculum sp. TaxID=1906242 RepID=UPI0017AAB03B|nr:helix-turn-helix transcriptional regulator [Tenacibaculum sp.]NVK09007.1 helix-turn-helix transcriptional regulator [Tenacibaculum sp.]
MSVKHYKPSKYLSPYIDRYFVCSQTKSLPLILPGTGLEVLFHIDTPLSINNKKLDVAHIICPREKLIFDSTNNVNYISVRFHSGGFRHFTSIPHTQIVNQYLSVEEIWNNEGRELLEILYSLPSIEEKIKLIDFFLCNQLKKHHFSTIVNWDLIIKTLYKNFNSISLHELAYHSNLSYRQFERLFKQKFGVSPKKFQRITKLQKTVKQVLLSSNKHYLSTALDNGYYDQSHFIKEFQSFTNLKPSQYFVTKNFENHFYYKPLS